MSREKKYIDYKSHDFLKDELFVKWVLNNSPEVADFWDKWVAEHPGKSQVVAEAKELILGLSFKEEIKLEDDEYLELYEAILKEQSPNKGIHFQSRNPTWYRVAAALIVLGISIAASIFYIKNSVPDEIKLVEVSPEIIMKSTNSGEKLTFRLPDGSVVKLNSMSQLSYKDNYGQEIREVSLLGEAFFEVAKDSLHPFIVKSEKLTIQALGTSFNVNSYQNSNSNSITLVTGRVAVQSKFPQNEVVLSPGQQAKVFDNQSDITVRKVFVRDVIDWKNDILSINTKDFNEVVKKLELWYGVEIQVTGKPRTDPYSGRFKDESLKNILDVLKYSSDFDYMIDKKQIKINFK